MAPAIEVTGLTKVFKSVEPDNRMTDSDMWFDYILGKVLGKGRVGFRPEKRTIKALSDVSFCVEEGEVFGVIGPNGAGKSTLVKCLSTALLPTSGRVRVLGFDAARDSHRIRNAVAVARSGGWVGFDFELSVLDNLMFWGVIDGVPRARVRAAAMAALELLDLAGKSKESPGALSSGMRQRMVLAKGLVANASVFLLDEPTTGLDPKSAYQVRSLVKYTLNKQARKTVIYTSHNLQDIETMCDRICLLENGQVTMIESPLAVIAQSAVRVKSLLVHCLGFSGRSGLLGLPEGSTTVTSGPEDTYVLRLRTTNPQLYQQAESVVAAAGATVLSSREETATLEDAFWTLTGRKLDA
jgi:ABC-2 type transport system ATP-binding protein